VNQLSVGGNVLNFYSSYNYACAAFNLGAVVFSCNPLVLLYTLRTPFLPNAIALVAPPNDANHCIFIHKDEINKGTLVVHRIPSSALCSSFRCSKSEIRCVSISMDGKYIATTSEKGTIVRLWDINGNLIHESRRGFFNANIEHISFSPDSLYFCVSSSHQTAHIFKCEKTEDDGYFLPKAEVRVSLESSKTIRAYILEKGRSLCLINDKGACLIYSINIATGESGIKSQIMLPTIAKILCPQEVEN
jgi:WD40 repeat protein